MRGLAGASLEQIAREAGVDVLEVQRRFIGLMDKGLVDLQLNQLELRILESARSGINVKEIAEQTGVSEETINWEINRLRAMTLLDDNLKLMPLGYHILIKTKK
ncbi:HTH domain-containing protein [Vulcanisaeta sp. JCM 14467]|uniref:HTH domain-containing protein n=1 Tax=Vulcanisaeta sp. JCM 14467 TaxID=1295370 RepID=UPI0006CF4EFD|nr:HTH domain-containing protein [Vulcanisaeta sp. JCM 14467]